MNRFGLILIALPLFTLAGCPGMTPGTTAYTPSEDQWGLCRPDQREGQDLGTGRAVDIRRSSPRFLSLRPEGWSGPSTPFEAESVLSQRQQFESRNAHLREALSMEGTDVHPEYVKVDDVSAFDLVVKPKLPYRTRLLHHGDDIVVMVTPGICPHVFGKQDCSGGQPKMNISVTGTVPCIGPFTVKDNLLVAFEDDQGNKRELVLGKPLVLGKKRRSSAPPILFDLRGRPIGKMEVNMDDFSGAVPAEVLSSLDLGEKIAAQFYSNVPDEMKNDEFDTKLKKARIQRVKQKIESATDDMFIAFATSCGVNDGLPGDDEVAKMIRERMIKVASELSPPKDVHKGLVIVQLIRTFNGTDDDVTATGVEAKYGPLFSDGTISDQVAWQRFAALFPKSQYTASKKAALQEQEKQAQAEQDANRKAREIDSDFQDLFETVRDIATKRQQATFAMQHAQMSYAPNRLRAAAQFTMNATEEARKNDFCPAKRDFIKKYGMKEYQERVKRQCEEDPPIGQAEYGREVRLDGECRNIFGSGC